MRILLSNDDGVFAPGITNLKKRLSKEHEVIVVAPLDEKSSTGHSLSLDRPIRLREIEENVYGVSGFPADCILMGLAHVCKEQRPDIVISGINRGANLGQDLYYSGTIAAAREASFHGLPSIAVSLVCGFHSEDFHWDNASNVIQKILHEDIHKAIPQFSLLNINVPNLPAEQLKECKITTIGFRDYEEFVEQRVDTRNREYFWVAGGLRGHHEIEGSDCMAVANGHISFTPHQLIGSMPRDFSEIENICKRL